MKTLIVSPKDLGITMVGLGSGFEDVKYVFKSLPANRWALHHSLDGYLFYVIPACS